MKTRLINLIIKLVLKLHKTKQQRNIAIVKLDEIGDFIIFRNQIQKLHDNGYKKITLIGNLAWKNLVINLDSKYIDDFIFINKKQFNSSLIYKFSILNKLSKLKFNLLIHPTQSRDYYISDFIVSIIFSKKKVGMKSDLINSNQYQLSKSDKFYTKLIDCVNVKFEKDKYNFFFQKGFNIKTNIDYLIKKPETKKQCVIFIGASDQNRRWSKYEKLINLIYDNFEKIIICGGSDSNFEFVIDDDNKIINLINKTTLIEFRKILSNSTLLITNESFPHHLAVETCTNCIVLSNGNNYSRFHPYPKKYLNSKHLLIYPKTFNYHNDNSNLPSIDDISEKEVYEKILTTIIL